MIEKILNTWNVNNMLLNNPYIKDYISKYIEIYT